MKNYLAVVINKEFLCGVEGSTQPNGENEAVQTYIIEANDEESAREIICSQIGLSYPSSSDDEDYDDEDYDEDYGVSIELFERTNNGILF
jgi:hypothetical protein